METAYAPHHNRKRLLRMLQNGEVGDEVNRRMATIEVLCYQKTAATEEYEAARLGLIDILRQFNYNNEITLVDPVDVWALDYARKYAAAPAAQPLIMRPHQEYTTKRRCCSS